MATRGNLVVPLLLLAGGAAAVWGGITDPEGGIFAGLGALLRGETTTPRAADLTGFLPTLTDLSAITHPALATAPPGTGQGGTAHTSPTRYTGGTGTTGTGTGKGAGAGAGGAAGPLRQRVIAASATWLGVPYRWGGASRSGVDCSGLTMMVYRRVGITLPHYSGAQALLGRHVALADAQPGDLVFFGAPVHHVGIYLGGGMIRNAPHTGAVVRDEPIWHTEPVFARDVLTGHTKPARQAGHPQAVAA